MSLSASLTRGSGWCTLGCIATTWAGSCRTEAVETWRKVVSQQVHSHYRCHHAESQSCDIKEDPTCSTWEWWQTNVADLAASSGENTNFDLKAQVKVMDNRAIEIQRLLKINKQTKHSTVNSKMWDSAAFLSQWSSIRSECEELSYEAWKFVCRRRSQSPLKELLERYTNKEGIHLLILHPACLRSGFSIYDSLTWPYVACLNI